MKIPPPSPIGCTKLYEAKGLILVNNKSVSINFNADFGNDNTLYLVSLNLFYMYNGTTGREIVEQETNALVFNTGSSFKGYSYINMNGSIHKVAFNLQPQSKIISCTSSAFVNNSYEITATIKVYQLVQFK